MVVSLGDSRLLSLLLEVFLEGPRGAPGVVILPTDTVYGIHGLAPETGERIRAIKGRREDRPFITLIPGAAELEAFLEQPLPEELQALWPGPLTLLAANPQGESRAFRAPADPLLQQLLLHLPRPLYSTSANRTGIPPLTRFGLILKEFGNAVDMIVDGGDLRPRPPSTLLDIRQRPYRILRQGRLEVPAELLSPQAIR
ncbi:MAG: L-threonylcarbamoyladenylate synthase [Spirochaetales bacterium]|jgi:L-threonylcarbamoyladenylate synthase|nr:L-threonylcarbamoyladenylate synthase [Spirochaetales bacterium]